MLPAGNRLTKKEDFARAQRQGRRFIEGNLLLQITENKKEKTRAGFVVGIRFSKKAVERNRLKRLLREIFLRELGKISAGLDIVVSVKGKATGREKQADLQKAMLALLKKAGCLARTNK